jgi:putative SOS response-associated peptidase YedK
VAVAKGGRSGEVRQIGVIENRPEILCKKVDTKPAFREPFRQRRCLVPVDNFYEWKKVAGGRRSPTRSGSMPAA